MDLQFDLVSSQKIEYIMQKQFWPMVHIKQDVLKGPSKNK